MTDAQRAADDFDDVTKRALYEKPQEMYLDAKTAEEKVTIDLSAWAEKWRNRREGLVMRAAIMEIERLRGELQKAQQLIVRQANEIRKLQTQIPARNY